MYLLGLNLSKQGEGLFTEFAGDHDNVAVGMYFNKSSHAVRVKCTCNVSLLLLVVVVAVVVVLVVVVVVLVVVVIEVVATYQSLAEIDLKTKYNRQNK